VILGEVRSFIRR